MGRESLLLVFLWRGVLTVGVSLPPNGPGLFPQANRRKRYRENLSGFDSDVSYYRWRKEYGGMTTSQVKRLKELEKENQRLRKAVSGLTLDKLILQEAAKGNF